MSVTFKSTDTPEERDRKLAEMDAMDKITTCTVGFKNENHGKKPHKPAEELLNSDNPLTVAAARLYLAAVESNAMLGRVVMRGCGSFGGADVYFILKLPGFRRPGFRGWLKDLLVRWQLIEEF